MKLEAPKTYLTFFFILFHLWTSNYTYVPIMYTWT